MENMFDKGEKEQRPRSTAKEDAGGQSASQSIIGPSLQVMGTIENAESLRVEGRVIGDISATSELVIAQGGRVEGDVSASRIVAAGTISGDLRATDELVLVKTAKVIGNVNAPVVVMESGASMDGNLKTGSLFDAKQRWASPHRLPAVKDASKARSGGVVSSDEPGGK